jgi:hypothetical protein
MANVHQFIRPYFALLVQSAGYICTNESRNRHRFLSVLQQAGPYGKRTPAHKIMIAL